jgi:hypothetical protein
VDEAQQPRFLNPLLDIDRHANRLPHWQQAGATIFVTFRLADSIPEEKLGPWRDARDAWLRLNPKPWTDVQDAEYRTRFAEPFEGWLDAGAGSCVLSEPNVAGIVARALDHFEGSRSVQHAWVIMPNHVHALFSLCEGWRLEKILQSWKRFSAHEINRLMGRTGTMWQEDYYDRMIRDGDRFRKCVEYIRSNPVKAGLPEGRFLLFERAHDE